MLNRYVEPALEQTIQDLPDAKRDGAMALWLFTTQRGPILPPWGTRERERVLRLYDRHEYNTLWQGAKMGLVKKWQSIPWVIDGGKNLTNQYQQILFQSQFGFGWDSFMARVGSDYLSFDAGAFIEVIGPGDPLKPPKVVTGLAHLDSYYCLPTGDPEFPVVYWSRYGKLHLLHQSRVIRLVDMPDGDQNNPGYGHCALSRAIAVVERELNMQRYIVTELSDIPSPGAVIANNLSKDEVNKAFNQFRTQQNADAPPDWGRVAWFYNMDVDKPASLENFTFARPPVNFDWNTYVQIDVDMLALALGVDRQDIWPLQTRAMGSGAQSEILAEKAKGKTFGQFLVMLERKFNDLLPDSLEFSFKTSDPQQSTLDANAALGWANAINIAGPRLSINEGRALLANQSEMINEVVTDDAGQMIELDDTDIQPQGEPTIAPDDNPAPPATPALTAKPESSAGSTKGLETDEQRRWFFAHLGEINARDSGGRKIVDARAAGIRVSRIDKMNHLTGTHTSEYTFSKDGNTVTHSVQTHSSHGPLKDSPLNHTQSYGQAVSKFEEQQNVQLTNLPKVKPIGVSHSSNDYFRLSQVNSDYHSSKDFSEKDFTDTASSFSADFVDLVHAGLNDDLNRRRAGTVLRAQLNRYGKQAREDGLKDGGVEDGLDDSDRADHLSWLADQSQYATNFLNEVYGKGLSDAQVEQRASMWVNKSLETAYYGGLASADKNGLYQWQIGASKEHCVTCLAMNGQKHRLKDYVGKGILPQSDALACKGYQCQCSLMKTSGKAQGSWAATA